MITLIFLAALLTLLPLTASHFTLDSPPARGFDEDLLVQFPCGGQNTVSPNRTLFPIHGGPVQLTMEHDEANVQVLLSLGNDPGGNFNITLLPTIQEQGIGKFCLGDIGASGMGPRNITDGMNATIQVVTNGDPSGGLYNCADITFSSTAQPGTCTNGTGVKAVPYTGNVTNANETNLGSASGSSSGSKSGGVALSGTPGRWLLLGCFMVVGAAAL